MKYSSVSTRSRLVFIMRIKWNDVCPGNPHRPCKKGDNECVKSGNRWYWENCKQYKDRQLNHIRNKRLTDTEFRDRQIQRVKEHKARVKYGMTLEEYESRQAIPCAICGMVTSNQVIDHNHNTGEVRGVLCASCNKGIGLLGDSIPTLKRAICYLQDRGSYA